MVKLKEEELKQAQQEKNAQDMKDRKDSKTVKGKAEKNKDAKDKATKVESTPIKTNATLADLEVLLYPLVTEKAVGMIESENKITFVVNDKTSKSEIKKRIQEAYGVKVVQINIIRDMKGRKKAIVKLDKKYKASELATKLGVL
ncbi:MAG: 50S ribosomal protein L23 [archaeon]|jgi:ribosomal protein uL23